MKISRQIRVYQYQDIILRKYASETERDRSTYYRFAIDEYILNQQVDLKKAGITTEFLKESFKNNPKSYTEIPQKIKEAFNLPSSLKTDKAENPNAT